MSAADKHEPFVVYPNRTIWETQMFFCVVLTPGLAAFTIAYTVGLFYVPHDVWTEPIGVMALIFHVALVVLVVFWMAHTAWELPWLLHRAPLLVIDERGVTDRSSPSAVGFIAREEIEAVFVCRYGHPSALGLRVRGSQRILKEGPWRRRLLHWLGKRPGRASFIISPRALPVGAEQLAHEISEHYGVPAGIALPGDD